MLYSFLHNYYKLIVIIFLLIINGIKNPTKYITISIQSKVPDTIEILCAISDNKAINGSPINQNRLLELTSFFHATSIKLMNENNHKPSGNENFIQLGINMSLFIVKFLIARITLDKPIALNHENIFNDSTLKETYIKPPKKTDRKGKRFFIILYKNH
ncbi:hypothetical protein GCM10023230_21720 [Flavobacterium hankyongi]|uniref:Uncharacterized protein n=1 Tax=Flavobacterium hankyongi TaxID=1176532 RepID=A0ABP9A039_9FLAO